uniref:chitotriosidase-1-like n=1 Tax=Euleptes europaea TaxID=460621 RepID=UPI00254025D8|nr:chitotriosidase-1-like [Euleptes europaea]
MESLLRSLLVLLCFLIAEPVECVNEDATEEKIPSKFCNVYKHVATVAGTGGSKTMSFWHLNCPFEGHYALGDVAKRGSGQPVTWALMVKEEGNGLLKHPQGFRCVNESLLVQGKSALISSLTDDLGAWEIEADHAVTPDGLSAGTFIVMTTHSDPTENVYVLNEYSVMLKQHASLQPNNSEDGSPCKIVCYVTKWSQYRSKPAKFYPEDVNPNLCTHITFAFAIIRNNHLSCNGWNDESVLIPQIQALKKRNPALLTLLAVGGSRFGTAFSPMLSTAATRKNFIDSAIPILRNYDFDGIELHFEHPGCRGSPPKDKHRFTSLIEEMTAAFEKEAKETGNKKLLLTAAVAARKETIDAAYEVDKLSKHLDYISVMAYNFHDGFPDRVTRHNSPLYAGDHSEESLYATCKFAMLYWIQKGAPAGKLLMGFASFGHTFKLSTMDTSVGAPASGPARPGHYTHEAGLLSYYEICHFIKDGATVQWLEDQKVPYAYKGFAWVGYDNKKSFGYKAQFVKKHKLGGGSVWTIDLDDFRGTFCNEGPYPLTRELKRLLAGNVCSDAGHITVQTETIQPSTTFRPSTTLRPSTTFLTPATLQPASTLQPSTTTFLTPATLQPASTIQPSTTFITAATLIPASTHQTSTTLRPSTTPLTAATLIPASTHQTSTTLRPSTTFQTPATLRPATTLQTSTTLRPSTTLQNSTTLQPSRKDDSTYRHSGDPTKH